MIETITELANNPHFQTILTVVLLTMATNVIIDMIKTPVKKLRLLTKIARDLLFRPLVLVVSVFMAYLNMIYGSVITGNFLLDIITVALSSLLVYHIGYRKIRKLLSDKILGLLKKKG